MSKTGQLYERTPEDRVISAYVKRISKRLTVCRNPSRSLLRVHLFSKLKTIVSCNTEIERQRWTKANEIQIALTSRKTSPPRQTLAVVNKQCKPDSKGGRKPHHSLSGILILCQTDYPRYTTFGFLWTLVLTSESSRPFYKQIFNKTFIPVFPTPSFPSKAIL